MGRRGPKRESSEVLSLRGSSLAKARARQEEAGTSLMAGKAWLIDCLYAAIVNSDRNHMTESQLADESGISRACLSMFMTGQRQLSGDTMSRLCWAMDLQLAWPDGTLVSSGLCKQCFRLLPSHIGGRRRLFCEQCRPPRRDR